MVAARSCWLIASLLFAIRAAGAQPNSAVGIVLSPATFSILNPSVFGDNSAVVVGGSYGNRPELKTYLFSASLSHVRFQFGRSYSPSLGRDFKRLTTGLDYANGFGAITVAPAVDLVSGVEASIGYGLINFMDGNADEGMAAGVVLPVGARLSSGDVRITPYIAPGLFLTRQVLIGYALPAGSSFATNGLRLTLGAGVRVEVLRRLLIEAGVRKTQTANAITRQSIGIAYRFGNIDGHGLRDAGSFTLEMDNDFLARTSKLLDEDYTQGFHFSFDRQRAPRILERVGARLHRCFADSSCTKTASALAGQEIYTPQYYPAVQPDDRPFGGWLYGGVKSSVQSDHAQTSLSVKLGVTGKPSLAEQLQVTFHQLSPNYLIPPGWNNQLRAEPGLIVSLEKKHFFEVASGPLSGGLLAAGAASIGNILTDAEAGVTLRAGLNDPHQWVPTRQSNFGVHGSFGLRQDLVLRNLFLDGNTFRSGPRVHRIPLVWQKELGAGVTMGPIAIDYRKTVRSKEFTAGRRYHPYGTISITRRGLF